MHKYNAVEVILQEWMAIIWHESLFHTGTKSRRGLQDMRFVYTYGQMFLVIQEIGLQVARMMWHVRLAIKFTVIISQIRSTKTSTEKIQNV